jgi:hypothetical protein
MATSGRDDEEWQAQALIPSTRKPWKRTVLKAIFILILNLIDTACFVMMKCRHAPDTRHRKGKAGETWRRKATCPAGIEGLSKWSNPEPTLSAWVSYWREREYQERKGRHFVRKGMPEDEAGRRMTGEKSLFFGNYLLKRGLVTLSDVLRARLLQKKHNRPVGELARQRGWLEEEDIADILRTQEDSRKKFGEIAVKKKYLTLSQVNELINIQKDNFLYLGEALVQLGVITKDESEENLREFEKQATALLHNVV